MLLTYNCILLLKMSTWYSKHVEENIWRINNIKFITLVFLVWSEYATSDKRLNLLSVISTWSAVLLYMSVVPSRMTWHATILQNDTKIQNMRHFISSLVLPFSVIHQQSVLFVMDILRKSLSVSTFMTGIRCRLIFMSFSLRFSAGNPSLHTLYSKGFRQLVRGKDFRELRVVKSQL